jgi:hypothetical protein
MEENLKVGEGIREAEKASNMHVILMPSSTVHGPFNETLF